MECGFLRAQPALDCGAPLRSLRYAGLGGLTPPYAPHDAELLQRSELDGLVLRKYGPPVGEAPPG
jgi:hypothetical protein